MASDKIFSNYILNQIQNAGLITSKSMFGEYGMYSDGKLFALVCDNMFFVKPTESGRSFIKNEIESSPYPGAKPYFLIEDKLDDSDWISELVRITVKELPEPKPKKKKA